MLKCRINYFVKLCVVNQCSKSIPYKQHVVLVNQTRLASIRISPKKRDEINTEFFKWILLAIPVTSFGLGCWQVQRRKWKLNLIQNLNSRTSAAPVQLPENFADLDDMEYRPVIVRGRFLHDKEFTIGPRSKIDPWEKKANEGSFFRSSSSNVGFLVITPFKVSNRDDVILINRGWVHNKLKMQQTRPDSLTDDEIELTGVVRLQEKRGQFMPKNNPAKSQWLHRDLIEMAKTYGTLPVWLDVREYEKRPLPQGWPIPNQTRVNLRNEHTSYIITWFGLCGFTSWMWIRLFINKLPLP